ncbi:hypothetical protein [Bordetella avium]|uniref:hypothetical protein n=1 Tax=Bordetella avium TaxID=521 RepID=UPI000FDB0205|nr:hypothetical protein [Bordetella avium]AZY53277.1 hypothetical protein C0J07_12915 [Bordetella avium]
MMNKAHLAIISGTVDWNRDFLSDHAHQFVRHELHCGATIPGDRDNLIVSRCTAYLMQLADCSKATAETVAAQTVAEIASSTCRLTFDLDRSTARALFLKDPASGQTRVISAAEMLAILNAKSAVDGTALPHQH